MRGRTVNTPLDGLKVCDGCNHLAGWDASMAVSKSSAVCCGGVDGGSIEGRLRG